MEFTAKQIAAYIGGEIVGDENATVSTFAKIEEGMPGALSFLSNPKYTAYIYDTQSSIVLVNSDFVPEKPIKATLVASVGGVSNEWDFWVFPRRERKNGRGIAVSQSFKEKMARLYDDLATLGSPDAEKATVVVAEAGSPEVAKALSRGCRVVAVGKPEGVPNVKLGWWRMGKQSGTALLQHPVFGDLPHEGFLSPFHSIFNCIS